MVTWFHSIRPAQCDLYAQIKSISIRMICFQMKKKKNCSARIMRPISMVCKLIMVNDRQLFDVITVICVIRSTVNRFYVWHFSAITSDTLRSHKNQFQLQTDFASQKCWTFRHWVRKANYSFRETRKTRNRIKSNLRIIEIQIKLCIQCCARYGNSFVLLLVLHQSEWIWPHH